MHLVAAGAVTALGPDIARISAALRAGAHGYFASPRFRSLKTASPVAVGMAEPLGENALWEERMRWLSKTASARCWEALQAAGVSPDHIMLSLPHPRPGLDNHRLLGALRQVVADFPVTLRPGDATMLKGGHASGLRLLEQARSRLDGPEPRAVLVGGVDSAVDLATIRWIEDQERLKTTLDPKGMMPSEGAAYLLVVNDAWLGRYGRQPIVRIAGACGVPEPKPWYTEQSSTGDGLTRAIQGTYAGEERPSRVAATFCDLNGEAWRAQEWMYAYLRTAEIHSEPLDLREPAAGWGDVGAATGPLLVALAAHEMNRDPILHKTLLWAASATNAERAAVILDRPEEPRA